MGCIAVGFPGFTSGANTIHIGSVWRSTAEKEPVGKQTYDRRGARKYGDKWFRTDRGIDMKQCENSIVAEKFDL